MTLGMEIAEKDSLRIAKSISNFIAVGEVSFRNAQRTYTLLIILFDKFVIKDQFIKFIKFVKFIKFDDAVRTLKLDELDELIYFTK